MMKLQIHPECFNQNRIYVVNLANDHDFMGVFETFLIHNKRLMLVFGLPNDGKVVVYPTQIVGYKYVRENL